MDRILLFIRDVGHPDIVDLYPDDAAARSALAGYVREKMGETGTAHRDDDDDLIAAYFETTTAIYTIVGVAGGGR